MTDVLLPGGQLLTNVHHRRFCLGENCPIHSLSDHNMRHFPQNFRQDSGLMERVCPHGIGHPDPDGMAFFEKRGIEGMDIHGCDGCCR